MMNIEQRILNFEGERGASDPRFSDFQIFALRLSDLKTFDFQTFRPSTY